MADSEGGSDLYMETYVASNYIDMAKETVCGVTLHEGRHAVSVRHMCRVRTIR
jgi:hypothetical protein